MAKSEKYSTVVCQNLKQQWAPDSEGCLTESKQHWCHKS